MTSVCVPGQEDDQPPRDNVARLIGLRARVRAGGYQDDLVSEETNRLLFLRWMVRNGRISEWTPMGVESGAS